jgi:hypothetical protein
VMDRIVAPLGLRVDESSPWVDARLSDGSRVQTRFLCAPFSSGPMTGPRREVLFELPRKEPKRPESARTALTAANA